MTMRPGNRKIQNNILVKKPARVKVVSKSAAMKTEEDLPADILKTCKELKSVCSKIDKLEKEKQKLILIVLKYVPKSVNS